MDTKELIELVKQKYPALASSIKMVNGSGNEVMGEISFHNPRYALWFSVDDNSFIVGINDIHSHLESSDYELNLQETFDELDNIINDRVIVIGSKNKQDNFILSTIEIAEGRVRHFRKNSEIEIVSFSKEY